MAGPVVKQLTGTGRPDGLLLIAKAKTWVWEEFGEALEKDFQLASRKFLLTIQCLRKGKQYFGQSVFI